MPVEVPPVMLNAIVEPAEIGLPYESFTVATRETEDEELRVEAVEEIVDVAELAGPGVIVKSAVFCRKNVVFVVISTLIAVPTVVGMKLKL